MARLIWAGVTRTLSVSESVSNRRRFLGDGDGVRAWSEISWSGVDSSSRLRWSVSTSSIARRHKSKAILKSPLAAETFLAQNSIAFASMRGMVDASGSKDCNLAVTISTICFVVYGLKLSCRGSRPFALRRGRNRSGRLSEFAIPIRTSFDPGRLAYSSSLYSTSRFFVTR